MLQEYLNIKELPLLTQLALEKLQSGEIKYQSVLNRRLRAKKNLDIKTYVEVGLAAYLYNEGKSVQELEDK